MLPNKRSANDLTRSSFSGEDFKLDNLPSNLSRSVVSIALFDGQKVIFASSGIVIECQGYFTKFLTSASLAIALHGAGKDNSNVKIEVGDGRCVSIGFLEECNLLHEISVVTVPHVLDVCCVPLNHEVEFMPDCRDVLALGRDISGKVMAASGRCTDSHGSEDSEYLMFSTCKLSETLEQTRIFQYLVKPYRDRKRKIGQLNFHPRGAMKVNTFGMPFGDTYPIGVWREVKNDVASNIRENVVALASFNGFFIDHIDKFPTILTSASLIRNPDGTDEIVDGLRIEVLLPNKERVDGKLEYYSLHYNVAVVSIKNYNVGFPASLKHENIEYY